MKRCPRKPKIVLTSPPYVNMPGSQKNLTLAEERLRSQAWTFAMNYVRNSPQAKAMRPRLYFSQGYWRVGPLPLKSKYIAAIAMERWHLAHCMAEILNHGEAWRRRLYEEDLATFRMNYPQP